MDWFNTVLRTLVGGFCGMFGDVHPLISLTVISALVGVGMLWVFRLTSDQQAILTAKRRLQAYLLELRLFGDDLSLVWQAQKKLLTGNLRYLGLMLRPAVFLIVPVVILIVHLDAYYGRAPLRVGEAGVVTIQSRYAIAPDVEAPRLEAPEEIVVETPAVRAIEPRQFSWRVRPRQTTRGKLRFVWGDREWEKTIAAGGSPQYLSTRRASAWMDSLLYAGEDRLSLDEVVWVEVRYPSASIEVAGLELHWLVWFFVLSMVSAFALKGYFKVVL